MDGPGLVRFFGNHDVDWRDPKLVKKHLDAMLPGIEVLEALKLRVLDGQTPLGLLFLVHGHQGTDLSDRASWLSRAVLRTVWRKIQNWQGWLSTTPAADYDLRAKHDIAMFHWSQGQALAAPAGRRAAMIAGHTHHPVFPDHPPPQPGAAGAAELEAEIAQARARGAGADELAPLCAELERLNALGRREPYTPPEIKPPTYFNTGCCCFPDRDVTGLEIADGKVTLVRWLDDDGEARPKELAPPIPLADLFARLAATSGQQRDLDVGLVVARVGHERGAARAVVGARPAGDRHRDLVRALGQHPLDGQRALRELDLDRAQELRLPDDGADPAVEAGVVAADLVAEAEAVALVRRALGHEADALLGRADEVQGARWSLRRSGARHEGGGGEGGGGAGAQRDGEAGLHGVLLVVRLTARKVGARNAGVVGRAGDFGLSRAGDLRGPISPVRQMKERPHSVSVSSVKRFPKGETLDRIVAAGLVVLGQIELWIGHAVPGPKALTVPLILVITGSVAFRRRWPLGVGVVVLVANDVLGAVGGYGTSVAHAAAWMCSLYAIAVWTDTPRFLVGVAVLAIGNVLAYAAPGGATSVSDVGVFTWLPALAMVLVRGAVRGRQLRADALAARAELLEREHELRAHEAVAEERARIARELHDLVAHNVSVMVVQAGAERHALGARAGVDARHAGLDRASRAPGARRGAPAARNAARPRRRRGARAAAQRRPSSTR